MRNTLRAFGFIVILLVTACAPRIDGAGPTKNVADIVDDYFVTQDGVKLPLRVWESKSPPKAVILGVHGFNDYGNFLLPDMPAFLQKNAIKLITYDQRGFGKGPHRGIWAGSQTMINDLANLIHLIHARHENLPLYVLGESMGGAVALTTLAQVKPLPVDGLILSAPAVWGPSTWPWYQKAALYTMSYTVPWLKLSGGGIVQPTDNIETWKNWSQDPLVIRATRVDALWGVSWLMEEALNAVPQLDVPTLLLYGEKDEVIPQNATAKMLSRLPENVDFSLYSEGWHWLPRDKNAPVVWQDILSWINDKDSPLPSGAHKNARQRLEP